MKNILKKTFLTLVFVIGFSLAVSAQSNDNRNTPPKEKPPTIPVKPKETPRPPNNDNSNKPKKPAMEFSEDVQKLTLIY